MFVSVVVIIGTSVAVVFVDAVVVVLVSVVVVKVRLIHHEWRCRSGRPSRVFWSAEPRPMMSRTRRDDATMRSSGRQRPTRR